MKDRLIGSVVTWLLALAIGLFLAVVLGACDFVHGTAAGEPDGGDGGGIIAITDGDAGPPGDGGAAGDGPQLATATLTETTSSTVATGHAIYCNNGGTATTRDNAWYRAFRPSDFGIAGAFHVAHVYFASEQAKGASIVVRIYSYTGTLGAVTLDVSKLTQLVTLSGSVPDSDTPQSLVAPIAADIAAGGTFVVEISGTDTQTTTGVKLTYYHAGANAAGQTLPGYFASAACGESTPTSQSNWNLILSVEGTY